MAKISVVVPVYNVVTYLPRCLDSILAQTHEDLEILLIDDGSTDGSGALCDEYAARDERIRVLHKANGGPSSARNMGLAEATGDYLGFVDSDDWIAPDMFGYLYELIDSTNSDIASIAVLQTTGPILHEQPPTVIERFTEQDILEDYLYGGARRPVPFVVYSKLYKRGLWQGIRFPEGKINEDIVTNYLVLARAGKLVKSNRVCYYYFMGGSSLTRGYLKGRDFDLLEASRQLMTLTQGQSQRIQYLAQVKHARGYFSLLAKIVYYGIDPNLNRRVTIRQLKKELISNRRLLLGAPIPRSRKLLISLMCISVNSTALLIKMFKMLKAKGANGNDQNPQLFGE